VKGAAHKRVLLYIKPTDAQRRTATARKKATSIKEFKTKAATTSSARTKAAQRQEDMLFDQQMISSTGPFSTMLLCFQGGNDDETNERNAGEIISSVSALESSLFPSLLPTAKDAHSKNLNLLRFKSTMIITIGERARMRAGQSTQSNVIACRLKDLATHWLHHHVV